MTSSSPRPHQLPYKINTFSSSNKETEDFKRALAEEIEPFETSPGASDPIFDLIIKLLKESKNPSAVDLLNYHFISCGPTPEALDYFYGQAKKGDAVARVQLGKLYREGQLTDASSELQVVAEAFASQHELAMLKLEGQLDTTEPTKGKVQRKDTGSEVFDGALDILDDEEQMEDIKEKAKKYEEMRNQPIPIERVEESTIEPYVAVPVSEEESLRREQLYAEEKSASKATKAKNKRSKKNPSKAKKAKGVVNG